jgi:hypothetical protein
MENASGDAQKAWSSKQNYGSVVYIHCMQRKDFPSKYDS